MNTFVDPVRTIISNTLTAGAGMACPSMAGPTGAGACIQAAQQEIPAQVEQKTQVHLPLGGDPNSKAYQAGSFFGEYVLPIVGGIASLARTAVKAALKAAALKAAREAAREAAARAAREAAAREAAETADRVASEAVGSSRVQRVVDQFGDQVVETGRPVAIPGMGSTDIDVVLIGNRFIGVGGPAKASNLAKFGQQLQRVAAYAGSQGGRAFFYYEEGTPQAAIDLAERWFGPGSTSPIR